MCSACCCRQESLGTEGIKEKREERKEKLHTNRKVRRLGVAAWPACSFVRLPALLTDRLAGRRAGGLAGTFGRARTAGYHVADSHCLTAAGWGCRSVSSTARPPCRRPSTRGTTTAEPALGSPDPLQVLVLPAEAHAFGLQRLAVPLEGRDQLGAWRQQRCIRTSPCEASSEGTPSLSCAAIGAMRGLQPPLPCSTRSDAQPLRHQLVV